VEALGERRGGALEPGDPADHVVRADPRDLDLDAGLVGDADLGLARRGQREVVDELDLATGAAVGRAQPRDQVEAERAGVGAVVVHADEDLGPLHRDRLTADRHPELGVDARRQVLGPRVGLGLGDRAVAVGVERVARHPAGRLADQHRVREPDAVGHRRDVEVAVVGVDRGGDVARRRRGETEDGCHRRDVERAARA
jgi:hypothetical protein